MLSRRRFLIALQILFILFCALDSLRAQITEQGFKPYGSFEGGNIDTVNLLNGHLNLHIPILSYPQRGDKLHLGFNVEKTAQIFQPWDFDCGQAETCFTWNYPGQGGIRDGIRIERDLSLSLAPDPVFTYKAHLTTADGGTHEMLPISSGIFTKDGTAYRSPTPSGGACPWSNYVTDRNGVRYTFGCTTPNTYALEYGWFEDPNGNKITENYDTTDIAKPLKTITDTMGRTIPFDYSNPPSGQTSNFAGCTGTLPTYTAYLRIVPTLGGGTQTYKSCYALLYINPPYDDLCSSDPTWCYPPGMQSSIALQSLVLPNGTTWTFQYDSADPNNPNSISYGDLLKITFPTGGSLSYTWHTTASQFDQCETSPSSHAWPFARTLSSRTLDVLNGTPGTWTYTFSATVNTYQTVVKDPNGNETAHLFTLPVGGCHFYETRTDQYRGASSPQNHTSDTTQQCRGLR